MILYLIYLIEKKYCSDEADILETTQAIIASKIIKITIYFTAQDQLAVPISFYTPGILKSGYNGWITSSLVLVPLFTASYTIDFNGKITPIDMYLGLTTNNDANATCKLQVSGDGGITFIDMTDEIPTTVNLITLGPGLWINNVMVGDNKLQIRVLGRSTDGTPATIKIRGDSFLDLTFNKNLI